MSLEVKKLILSILIVSMLSLSITLFKLPLALLSSESGVLIDLPSTSEIFNISPAKVSRYYVELWAVVPDGVKIVKKSFVNPYQPHVFVSLRELAEASSKWIDVYKREGRKMIPSIIVQLSFYSEEESKIGLAFGASVPYDPEHLTKTPWLRERFSIAKKDFALVRVSEIRREANLATLCTDKKANLQSSGLPGCCTPNPYDCNCCLCPPYPRLVLGDLVFDSESSYLPPILRGRISLIIAHLDTYSAASQIGVTYKISNVPQIDFKIALVDVVNKVLYIGGTSVSAQASQGALVTVDRRGYYGMIYFPATYKVYEAYEYTCCDVKTCDMGVTVYCEPACAYWTCGKYLLVLITYANPAALSRISNIPPEDMGVYINSIRSHISLSYLGSVLSGGVITVSRDPFEMRINPISIAALIVGLSNPKLGFILDIVSMIIGAEVIIRSSDTIETLEIYNIYDPGGSGVAYVYTGSVQAVYQGVTSSYRPLFIDFR